jgi:hypothetical protein
MMYEDSTAYQLREERIRDEMRKVREERSERKEKKGRANQPSRH